MKVLLPEGQTSAGGYTRKKLPETEEETAGAAPGADKAGDGKGHAKAAQESKAKE